MVGCAHRGTAAQQLSQRRYCRRRDCSRTRWLGQSQRRKQPGCAPETLKSLPQPSATSTSDVARPPVQTARRRAQPSGPGVLGGAWGEAELERHDGQAVCRGDEALAAQPAPLARSDRQRRGCDRLAQPASSQGIGAEQPAALVSVAVTGTQKRSGAKVTGRSLVPHDLSLNSRQHYRGRPVRRALYLRT